MDQPLSSSSKRILIVEDDYFILDLYKRVFGKAAFTVDTASDGEEAITKTRTNTYDIILLDIMLPKVTGIDVLRTVRVVESKAYHTPVFLITNLGQEAIIKEAFRMGADGYILKAQLTPQDVVSEVNAFFAKKQNAH